mmetsp:Transcript_12505/g.33063  ORF Transcript_12505/g.33063 Transcript_12505/m.33063 type:complete len:214 (+) Transcript_12505:2807-3448(+)
MCVAAMLSMLPKAGGLLAGLPYASCTSHCASVSCSCTTSSTTGSICANARSVIACRTLSLYCGGVSGKTLRKHFRQVQTSSQRGHLRIMRTRDHPGKLARASVSQYEVPQCWQAAMICWAWQMWQDLVTWPGIPCLLVIRSSAKALVQNKGILLSLVPEWVCTWAPKARGPCMYSSPVPALYSLSKGIASSSSSQRLSASFLASMSLLYEAPC